QTVIQCQVRLNLPVVLTIESKIVVRNPQCVRQTLDITLQTPQHEIRQAIDGEDAAAERAVVAVRLKAHHVRSKRQLMVSADHTDIVGELMCRPRPVEITRTRPADVERACYCQCHVVRWVVPYFDAEVRCGEKRRGFLEIR